MTTSETPARRVHGPLASPLARRRGVPSVWLVLGGLALLIVAGVMAVDRWGTGELAPWVIPLVVFLAALGLVWSPLDGAFGQDARRLDVSGMLRRDAWLRLLVGLALGVAALWWFAAWEFTDNAVARAIITPAVVVVGIGLLLSPWWLRLIRQVSVEREERIREHERAEIAAHLHDSVLQTLTMIRARASDPDVVARLARAQERDLRTYLYQDSRSPDESVATALADAVGEVEDVHGVAVDIVSVGDAPTDEALWAAVQATREAVSNAARHGEQPISVYAELTADGYEVFVRDSGPGFDPDEVPEDRLGIRQSIVGRVGRHGGTAEVRSARGDRTEVTIRMPREVRR
ncbi:sensor histidine kinase [uncultured Demequina sp.]|uniref:sensor histidine kinase n=1 Tax=uncultured Demequina sp. TaxID=693499 RepID=UPI0025D5FEDD|nr:ATP-binding protein [uncultured Demequina sp.]